MATAIKVIGCHGQCRAAKIERRALVAKQVPVTASSTMLPWRARRAGEARTRIDAVDDAACSRDNGDAPG